MKWFLCMNCDHQMPMHGGYFAGRKLKCKQCGVTHSIKCDGSHLYIEIEEEKGKNEDR